MHRERRHIEGFTVRLTHAAASTADDGLIETLVREAVGPRTSGQSRELNGAVFFAKGGQHGAAGARRHTLRRWLKRAPTPCEAELANLAWLRGRLFLAPEPVMAITAWKHGWLAGEMLLTAALPGVRALDDAWPHEADGRTLADELGAELGRMHALRFLHGDVYPRNLMVLPEGAKEGPGIGRRIAFLDAWAGGVESVRLGASRSLERDLGCLMLEAAEWMSDEEQRCVLDAYLRARASNGRPVDDLAGWTRRVERARAREIETLIRRPARLRGKQMPQKEWRVPQGVGAR